MKKNNILRHGMGGLCRMIRRIEKRNGVTGGAFDRMERLEKFKIETRNRSLLKGK